MEDEDNTRSLREYLSILRRRKGQILVVTALLAAVAVAVAIGLPSIYRSSATILVQEQEVPPDLVRSTITSFADERIQVISQQVMTRAVLMKLVEKYNLYEKMRERATPEEIVARMRKDIALSTIDANVSDRSSGRRVNATIAFELSYDSPRPEDAQRVVEDLVALYLEQNIKARQQSVAETTAFLGQEAERLAKQIQQIEANLAEFKRRYVGRMPDSSAVNMQLAERAQSELLRIDHETNLLQDRKLALEAQLALLKPHLATPPIAVAGEVIPGPEERLRALQAQYTTISAVYGADHPDIRRMQREIAALKAQTGAESSRTGDAADTLKQLEADVTALRQRYGEDHPDVQRLRRSIAALHASGAGERLPNRSAGQATPPDNPAYITLTSQLESTRRELAQLAALKIELRERQRTYDARLLQIPEIEREYRELTRDYENAQVRYRDIKAKQMQAEVSQELEKDRKAERFSLGEPANLPQTPTWPNRPRILLIGLIASLGGGLGLAWLRDIVDPSVKGPLELARIARVPILTPIPYIETYRERMGKEVKAAFVACMVVLLAAAFLWGLHVYLKPLPDLLDSVTRRIPFL